MLYYKWWLVLAGISGSLAVMAGAAGAHALRGALSPEGLEQFHTAVRYHFIHTLAIIACAFLLQAQGSANPLLPHLAAAAFSSVSYCFQARFTCLLLPEWPALLSWSP